MANGRPLTALIQETIMKKIIPVIILVLLGAGAYAYRQHQNPPPGEDAPELKIYGTIDIRDASLAFTEQEIVADILVEEGMRVAQGDVLARLRTTRLEAAITEAKARIAAQKETLSRLKTGNRPQEIDQASAQVAAAKARVDNVRQTLKRLEKTSGSGATSLQELDDARSRLRVEKAQLRVCEKSLSLMTEGSRKEDISAARHQLEALEAGLSQLQIRLSDMTLTAPAPGIIQSRVLEKGELAGPARPAFVLALTDPKWVRAYIPEPMLGKINLGMDAMVFSDSFPGQPIPGWVGFISPVAEFTPRSVATEDLRTQLVYEARVFVKDPEDRLRLGMPVTVRVNGHETGTKPQALSDNRSTGR